MAEQTDSTPSSGIERADSPGAWTDPNPGERSAQAESAGVPGYSLGVKPSTGNRAGGGRQIDLGAQVGIRRNLEFTAGGRAHRISMGTYGRAKPAFDPKSGQLHVSAVTDTGDVSLGGKAGRTQEPETPPVEGGGDRTGGSSGEVGADRRRDKETT
jgi:hypothetical protein